MPLIRLIVDGAPAGDAAGIDQRAFQFGDGLFETVAVVDGCPCLWSHHLDRLRDGCRRLGLPAPDPDLLDREIGALCADSDHAILKLYWTAGRSERGYRRPAPTVPMRVLALYEGSGLNDQDGWRIRTCRHRLSDNPALAGIKHLNRLDQVLARAEWDDTQINEGLMCGQDGAVICGTMTNLIVEKREALSTPAIDRAGIAGVVRRLAIETAEDSGEPLLERRHTLADIADADALYLTNSLIGVRRVLRWGDIEFDQGRVEHPVMAKVRQRCHDPDWRPELES